MCVAAAREVQRHIDDSCVLQYEHGHGKMFGVLVVDCGDATTGPISFRRCSMPVSPGDISACASNRLWM